MSKGHFVWHDLMTTDTAAALTFYQGLLGWTTEVQDMGSGPYTMVKAADKSFGGVNQDDTGSPRWISYISVENLDDSVAKIKELGGSVHETLAVPGVGTMAYATDPDGAEFAPFQDENADYQHELPHGVQPGGGIAWHELTANDQNKADAFYSEIFGWGKVVWPMDDGGEYHGLTIGEIPVAGVFKRPEQVPYCYWSIYFEAPGTVEQTVTDVKRLGGSVLRDTFTVEGTGDIAIVKDPAGAVFGLMKSLPMENAQ